ncbi:MAG: hypothetical protein J6N70_13315 [Oribacterium sp.]|nr:hypothetical protein [Oribacterium sp.]
MYDVESAERFIETVEYDYQSAALQANETVASYSPEFGHISLHGWNLEQYVFCRVAEYVYDNVDRFTQMAEEKAREERKKYDL